MFFLRTLVDWPLSHLVYKLWSGGNGWKTWIDYLAPICNPFSMILYIMMCLWKGQPLLLTSFAISCIRVWVWATSQLALLLTVRLLLSLFLLGKLSWLFSSALCTSQFLVLVWASRFGLWESLPTTACSSSYFIKSPFGQLQEIWTSWPHI